MRKKVGRLFSSVLFGSFPETAQKGEKNPNTSRTQGCVLLKTNQSCLVHVLASSFSHLCTGVRPARVVHIRLPKHRPTEGPLETWQNWLSLLCPHFPGHRYTTFPVLSLGCMFLCAWVLADGTDDWGRVRGHCLVLHPYFLATFCRTRIRRKTQSKRAWSLPVLQQASPSAANRRWKASKVWWSPSVISLSDSPGERKIHWEVVYIKLACG